MHKTIYFGSKPLYLCNDAAALAAQFPTPGGIVIEKGLAEEKVVRLLAQMQLPQTVAGIYEHKDVEELLQAFAGQMELVQAGGGLVCAPQKTVLLIFRRGKWDLPKGKLDEGETMEECAVREVQEETGLQTVTIEKPLTVTWHTYHQDGKLILKESHWYLMQTPFEQALVPQQDEDIMECKWAPLHQLDDYMQNTHPSILDVIKEGQRIL